jgi:hypothetical protein
MRPSVTWRRPTSRVFGSLSEPEPQVGGLLSHRRTPTGGPVERAQHLLVRCRQHAEAAPGAEPLAEDVGNEDRYSGVNRALLHKLIAKWPGLHRRRTEAAINAYEYDRVEVVGVLVHFVRTGVGPRRTLLILTDGWPLRFSRWSKVIDPVGQ